MRKSKFYEEDGILYATLRGFAEYLGVKEHTLWYYRRMGALIKVRTDKGLYFRVSDGWEIRSSRMLYKVGEDEEGEAREVGGSGLHECLLCKGDYGDGRY